MAEPQQGVAYTTKVPVFSMTAAGRFAVAPTFDVGDVQVSTDDATFVNIATLPVVTPAGGRFFKIQWTATEMGLGGPATGSQIVTQFVDQTDPPAFADTSLIFNAPVHTAASAYAALVILVATTGIKLTSAARTELAETLLDHEVAVGADTGSESKRTWRQYLYNPWRSRWGISGTTGTMYKPNDVTVAYTTILTPAPGADPVSAGNPAGP